MNNGWEWGQEVGRVGRWSPQDETYEEWDLGEDASNPVALHVLDGQLFTVNNGDWSSTSVTRVSFGETPVVETAVLANVSAGCNASAIVGDDLALQIDGETGLRLIHGTSLTWSEEVLTPQAPVAYSLAVHAQYDWVCSGVTDFVSFGEVQPHDLRRPHRDRPRGDRTGYSRLAHEPGVSHRSTASSRRCGRGDRIVGRSRTFRPRNDSGHASTSNRATGKRAGHEDRASESVSSAHLLSIFCK